MQNNIIDQQLLENKLAESAIYDMQEASIRDVVKVANLLEKASGYPFIRMEMGVPGLSPSRIGTEAEIEALKLGVAILPDAGSSPFSFRRSSPFYSEFHGYQYTAGSYHTDSRSDASFLHGLYGLDGMSGREKYGALYRPRIFCTKNTAGSDRKTV